MTRNRACLAGALAAAALLLFAVRAYRARSLPLQIRVEHERILADGFDAAQVFIAAVSMPELALANPHAAILSDPAAAPGGWRATVRTSTPGRIVVRATAGGETASATITATLSSSDDYGDGTPDFLRLATDRDRRAFRRWFTYLAEAQFFARALPPEITDCASLLRYAYRWTLAAHESGWAEEAGLSIVPALPALTQYHYPYTALGAGLFRITEGPFTAADLGNGAFAQFADAKTLRVRNAHLVGRNLAAALPGDLLFFRQQHAHETFHAMAYLGESQMGRGSARYVVYHTGPEGSDPGEIRRPAVEELLRHPQPEWRPIPANPAFLGVYRWNILRRETADDSGRE